MNKKISILIIAIAMIGCSPKLSFTWTQPDYSAKKFNKIAVFTGSKNMGIANAYQEHVVSLLQSKGYDAVKSFDLYPPTKKEFEEGELEQILLDAGVDGVITTFAADKEKSTTYVAGSNYGNPYGGYGFGYYYSYRYAPMYMDPGYYQETTTYILENHFYLIDQGDHGEDELVWTSQSVIEDPGKSISESYAKLIVESLISEGVIE